MPTAKRKGGLGVGSSENPEVNPAVLDWVKSSTPSTPTVTNKRRKDQARVRVKYDMPEELKRAIEEEAALEGIDTSASQFAAFLLAWAMKEYRAGNAEIHETIKNSLTLARSLRFTSNLDIPDAWLEALERGQ